MSTIEPPRPQPPPQPAPTPPASLTDLLAPRPDDENTVAVYSDTVELTRAQLRARARVLAAALSRAGLRPGQPVASMPQDGAAAVVALFGTWYAQGVYVPVNPRLTGREVARVVAEVRPALVVTSSAHAERFPGLPVLPLPAPTPPADHVPTPPAPQADHAPTLPAPPVGLGPHPPADAPVHDPDTALIQFTSGTTGRPRPVVLPHSGIRELMEPVLRKLVGPGRPTQARGAPMPNLIPTSMSLWAGIYNVLFAFRVGAPVILMDRFDPDRFAAHVHRFRLRSVVLPPAAMVMLTDADDITDLTPLRYVRSITAPLSPFQARRFRARFGVTVLNCYGQTEIGGEIVGWNAADARAYGESKLGAVGRPHDGVSLRVGPGGELQVRTPALATGRADARDRGNNALRERFTDDGWFRTGDVGRIDDDGFLWIDGRVSDLINRGGLKVFPAEVAEVLRTAERVADCAVAGMPDDRLGEVPWAFVVPADSAHPPRAADLDAVCRAHLAPYKVPVRFVAVSELPRNEVGKVRIPDLVALASSGALPDDPPTAR